MTWVGLEISNINIPVNLWDAMIGEQKSILDILLQSEFMLTKKDVWDMKSFCYMNDSLQMIR